jgi:hypothetical protein
VNPTSGFQQSRRQKKILSAKIWRDGFQMPCIFSFPTKIQDSDEKLPEWQKCLQPARWNFDLIWHATHSSRTRSMLWWRTL